MEDGQIGIEELLRINPLFKGLEPWQISELVDRLDVLNLADGELLYSQGESGDSLYIIYSGEVLLSEGRGSDEVSAATMLSGDFFGEESVLHRLGRRFTVRAVGDTSLLRISSSLYHELTRESAYFRTTLEAGEASLDLASRMNLRWLRPHEAVHIITRKHIMLLWLSLIAPILLGLTSIVGFGLAYITQTLTPAMCGIAVVIVSAVYAAWKAIDWANDYYIVTDQRVVWLERIIGLYESRQEAPMRTLLAVDLGTDQIGRIFGYGDVIVRTYTTQIVLEATAHPEEVAAMIKQYWRLSQSSKIKQEEEEMVHILREQLGLEEDEAVPPASPPPRDQPAANGGGQPSLLNLFYATNFKMRYEQGSTVTYRKHWYLLLRKTWLPALCMFLVVLFTAATIEGSLTIFTPETALVIGTALLAVIGSWWLYRFVDWRNDMYQMTTDSIIDIYRKPLGTEVRKAAPLENILSLSHERIGILGVLLNFGNVRASIGDTVFTFDGVSNPAQVQQEIFLRMDERIEAKRRSDNAQERIRMAEWLAAYHRNVEEIREEEEIRDQLEQG